MKNLALVGLLLFISSFSYSQNKKIDSLNRLIAKAASDTQKVNLTILKIRMVGSINLDSAIALANKTIGKARQINYKKGEADARIALAGNYCFKGLYGAAKQNLDVSKQILSQIQDPVGLGKMNKIYGTMYSMQNKFDSAHLFFQRAIAAATLTNDKVTLSEILQNDAIAYQQQSNFPQALLYYQKAMGISAQLNDEDTEAYIYVNIAITYEAIDDNARAEQSYLKAEVLAKKLNLKLVLAYTYANLSSLYEGLKRFKDQYDFGMKAALLGKQMGDEGIEATGLSRAALALSSQNKFDEAEKLNRQSMVVADASKQPYNIYQAYSDMAIIFYRQKEYNEAIPYFEKAFRSLTKSDLYTKEVGLSYAHLSECYEKTGDYTKALATYKISAEVADSVRGRENIKKATELTMNYDFEKKQQITKLEQQKQNEVAKTRQIALSIGLVLTLILAGVAFNGFKNKRRANHLLQQQKDKVESTLTELKSTQAQLIQSAKMASLGELTAGIAHEIQNPLNFVNNFSEVSMELLAELKDEEEKGNKEDVMAIADDLTQNLEKIKHHGKRADAIVKGMLQHSQSGSGVKEPTNINTLADECIRLSYHGLRAKDKSFNAVPIAIGMVTHFDEKLPRVNVIPQDMVRVMLNLFNNAFYAVNQKQKNAGADYKPEVSVTTSAENGQVIVSVKDNGIGIPDAIKEKIMQPFFTTKPSGEGTGLGLSLTYDMVVKGHGGSIQVDSVEGEGSEFTFSLPVA
jgi:two-component system NtrC family sensor kinase